MRHVLNTLKKDDVFVDVGAGLGDYSLLAASKITTGKIYSFEPHPEAFKLLSENMQLNNLEKILKPYNSAVTNKNGVVRFVAHEVSELSRISSRANDESTISVSATTLDTFCEQNTINNIDVLKVDVEGAERSVFLGAKNMLKQGRIKQIIFELNTNPSRFNDESRFQTLEYLEKNSFRFYSFENQNATYTKKNILDIKTTQNILARLV